MKNEKNKARDALSELVEKTLIRNVTNDRYTGIEKPGDIIQSLGPIKRHILEDLKSEDIKDIRWP